MDSYNYEQYAVMTNIERLATKLAQRHVIQINDVLLDMRAQKLVRNGQSIDLEPSAWRLLVYLVSHPHELHSKNKLADLVWKGAVIGDAAISQAVLRIRAALNDSPKNPQFIETVHRRGYRFVAKIDSSDLELPAQRRVSLGRPLVDGVSIRSESRRQMSLRDHVFVGREEELDLVVERLVSACDGGFEVLFVEGAAGIGKSALLDSAIARVQQLRGEESVFFAQVQCVEEIDRAEPYLPIFRIMAQLYARYPSLLTVAKKEASGWLQNASSNVVNGVSQHNVPVNKLRRQALAGLSQIVQTQPLILVVEDVHWSDAASLELASFVAQTRALKNFAMVLSIRSDMIEDTDAHRLIKKLSARQLGLGVFLQPFSRNDVGKFVEESVPHQLAGRREVLPIAEYLWERAEGHPLFTKLLLEHILGELMSPTDLTAISAQRLSELSFSHALSDALEVRLLDVPMAEREVLHAASVVGTRFTVLEGLATQGSETKLTAEIVGDICERLVESGLIARGREVIDWIDGATSSGYRFAHALYQRKAYEMIALSTRRLMHRNLAEKMVAQQDSGRTVDSSIVARHYFESGDVKSAVVYLEQAAEVALARGGTNEACANLDKIVQQVSRLEPSIERDMIELRSRVRRGIMSQLMMSDDDQKDNIGSAVQIANRIWNHPPAFEVIVETYRLLFHCSRPDLAGPLARKICSLKREDTPATHLVQMLNVRGTYALSQGKVADAAEDFDESSRIISTFKADIDQVRDASQQWLLSRNLAGFEARVLALKSWVFVLKDQIDESIKSLSQAISIATKYPTLDGEALLLTSMACIYALANRTEEALLTFEKVSTRVRELELEQYAPGLDMLEVWAMCQHGELFDCSRIEQKFLGYMRYFGASPFPVPAALAIDGLITLGEVEIAERLLEKVLRQVRNTRLIRFMPEVLRLQARVLIARDAQESEVYEVLDSAFVIAAENDNALWIRKLTETRENFAG